MAEEWEMERLEFHEGCRLKPYRCPKGKVTIGIGRNIEDNPFTPQEKKAVGNIYEGITRNCALMLLRNDIARCKKELGENIVFYGNLDRERKYALLDMCFNMGIEGLLKFKNMLKNMEDKDFKKASYECLHSSYAKQVPKRAKRIAHLIKTGVWKRYIDD